MFFGLGKKTRMGPNKKIMKAEKNVHIIISMTLPDNNTSIKKQAKIRRRYFNSVTDPRVFSSIYFSIYIVKFNKITETVSLQLFVR